MVKYTLAIVFSILFFSSSNSTFAQKKEKKKKESEEVKKQKKGSLSEADSMQVQFLFLNGLKEKTLGNTEAAIEYFRRCLNIDINNHAAMYELGRLYFTLNDNSEAIFLFTKASELNPQNEWYLISLANAFEQANNYKEASRQYEKLIRLKPENLEYYFDYASMFLFEGRFEEAIKVYEEIQQKIGLNEDVSIQKEKIWLRLGKVDKAIAEIQALIDYKPKEIRYLILLGEIYMANTMSDKAYEIYQKALLLEPDNAYVLLAIADYYRTKGDDENAFLYVKQVFRNPEVDIDRKVQILAPYFATLANDVMQKRAIELSQILIYVHPKEAKAHAIYGDFLYQDKQLKEACEQYQITLQYDKKVFAVWQNLIFIQADLLDYQGMLTSTNEALTLFPNQTLLYYLNGAAYFQLKKYTEAIETYKSGLALGTDNIALEAQLYAGLGDAYHALNKHKESDEAYEDALKTKPDETYVLNNYAYYLSLRGEQLEKAEKMSKRSNELMPNNASFQDTYGWIMYKLNRLEEAKVWIEKAITTGEAKSATVIEHYGDILFKLGAQDEALAQWKKAKEIGGSESGLLNKKISERKLYE